MGGCGQPTINADGQGAVGQNAGRAVHEKEWLRETQMVMVMVNGTYLRTWHQKGGKGGGPVLSIL